MINYALKDYVSLQIPILIYYIWVKLNQNYVIVILQNILRYVIKKNNILNVLSYGINTYDDSRSEGTTHAEINAIKNIVSRSNNGKHLIGIDILVIRTSNTGKIGMSKPCVKCIIDLSTLPQKKGYIIKNIYYSNNEGLIIRTTIKNLILAKDFHVSRYYQNHNFKFNI